MKLKYVYTVETELEHVVYLIKSFQQYKDDYPNNLLPKNITADTNINNLKPIKKQILSEMNMALIEKAKLRINMEWDAKQTLIDTFFANFSYPSPKIMTVRLTRYGTGGTYNYHKPYYVSVMIHSIRNLTETVVHETIHCLIEQPVIIKYQFDHPTKEGLVDWLFLNDKYLREIFPDYQSRPPASLPNETLIKSIGWNRFK